MRALRSWPLSATNARDSGKQVFKFNYNDVIKGKSLEQNVPLEPDDMIVVK
jgi:hypothetical protein